MTEVDNVPTPPQYNLGAAPAADFRFAATGIAIGRGMTKKRKVYEEQQAELEQQPMEEDEAQEPRPRHIPKRQKLNTVGLGKGSGRTWKEPATRASLVRNPLLATSWEKKMADKAQAQAFKEARQVSIDARKEKMQKLRKQREATKARKEENRRKSLVTQKISNPATLKRMMASKKGRKKLVTVDAVKATK